MKDGIVIHVESSDNSNSVENNLSKLHQACRVSLVHSLMHSLVHSLTYSLISFIHPFTHLFIHRMVILLLLKMN